MMTGMIRKTAKLVSVMLLSLLVAGVGTIPAGAVDASGFKAGYIISDGIFTDKNSMSTSQIQNFLNNKVPSCDTNGTQPASEFGRPDLTHAQYAASRGWQSPPYTCLRNFSEGGKSAARIIYDKAQQFSISPKVLIVLLQKEQALVTDTWPLDRQYRSATGYGCPDTAPCASEYYGFTNQLTWAARMFRSILNDSPTWYTPYELGNNSIPWHPNTSSCGYSTVNIVNRSTQALYNYTPYRPNQAALNAGYGTGNSCSSYGNRNFYLYFNDWFGSTYQKYDASIVSVEVFSNSAMTNTLDADNLSLQSGQKAYVRITARNNGSENFNSSTKIATVNSRNHTNSPFYDSSWLTPNRITALEESSVSPTNTGTFDFAITAPSDDIGSFTDYFGLVQTGPGGGWMDSEMATIDVDVTPNKNYDSKTISSSFYTDSARTKPLRSSVKPGSKIYGAIRVKNIGNNSWGSSVNIETSDGSALQDSSWVSSSKISTLESTPITTGNIGEFRFVLSMPEVDGNYSATLRPVADGASGGNMSDDPINISIKVSENSARLYVNDRIYTNDLLLSRSEDYKFVLQGDGNLVLYSRTGGAIWSTKTNGTNANRLVLQGDGNLVLYRSDGRAVWSTGTNGTNANRLVLQNDGNMVLYKPSGGAVWSTNTRWL